MPGNFTITIKGMQVNPGDTEGTELELVSECEFYKSDGVYFCEYLESEITGLQGTKTTIEIADDYVSLTRNGTVNSHMLFMAGRQTTSLYTLPFGELNIEIHTKTLNTDIGDLGGTIYIDYLIDINNASGGRNTFDISIQEEK